jgi:hypothetical protein
LVLAKWLARRVGAFWLMAAPTARFGAEWSRRFFFDDAVFDPSSLLADG